MWIRGKFMTEPEIQAYINEVRDEAFRKGSAAANEMLVAERDAYRNELIELLRKECECIMGNDTDCSICPYYTSTIHEGCPSKTNTYTAKLRLEELCKSSY